MKAIIIIALIWAAAAFIYCKVKKVSFAHAMVNVPLILIKWFFEAMASNSQTKAIDFRSKKQYDAAEKMNEASAAAEIYANMAASAKNSADSKFNKDE